MLPFSHNYHLLKNCEENRNRLAYLAYNIKRPWFSSHISLLAKAYNVYRQKRGGTSDDLD